MRTKVFYGKHSEAIETEINRWLEKESIELRQLIDWRIKVGVDRENKASIGVVFLYG